MKKLFLVVLTVSFAIFTYAQQTHQLRQNLDEQFAPQNIEQTHNYSTPTPSVKPPQPNYPAGSAAKDIVIREIGDAGNPWGLSSGGRTYMWADNDINSVVFLHRMLATPGTGYLAYDVSTDNGATFEVNQQVWDPALYPLGASLGNARYPQIAIYNPAGNIDPANAIVTWFAPILDQTNGDSWGGYGMGTNPLTAVNPTTPTQFGLPSPGNPLIFSVPDAFHMTNSGTAICIEPSLVDGLFANYTGYLINTYGTYNETTMLFDYEQELIDFDITGGGDGTTIPSLKIAFHPDGQIGYMAMLSNDGSLDDNAGAYYPILFKTEDGGENWDGPYPVQIGGPDGLPIVLEYLTDENIQAIFVEPYPERDEILFTTAFDMDLSVDMYGNPHLFFAVGVGSGEWSIITSIPDFPDLCSGTVALIHAASYDGMDTWYADSINLPRTFRGLFPGTNDLNEDLRPYISSTPDASKLFFSWQDTRVDFAVGNRAPDIFCVGYRVEDRAYTDKFYVTEFTSIMWQSWMATASYEVFDDGAGNYEIPFACQIMDPDNNGNPVSFRYVDNFVITDADFGVWVSTAEPEVDLINISNNYPNPCRDFTNVNVSLTEAAYLSLEISNVIGQKVKTVDYGLYTKGLHTLKIDASELESGIYIYTLSTGADAVAGKMIVE